MKKSLLFSVAAVIGLSVNVLGTSNKTQAANIDITESMPKSGHVELNGSKVVNPSSPLFVNQTHFKSNQPWFTMSLYALNIKNGRWVTYSDHHNYLNGYKWSHSRFMYYSGLHTASARVGSGRTITSTANSGQWADATAKGYGLAQAWYNIL